MEALPVTNTRAGSSLQLDLNEWLAILRSADTSGAQVRAIFHSHVDQPLGLSRRDRQGARISRYPAVPGAALIVVGVRQAQATEVSVHIWDREELRLIQSWRLSQTAKSRDVTQCERYLSIQTPSFIRPCSWEQKSTGSKNRHHGT